MKIREKLLINILIPVIFVFAAMLWLNSMSGRAILKSEIKQRAENMLLANAWELQSKLGAIEDVAQGLAVAVESFKPATSDSVNSLIRTALLAQPMVYGSTISFEPGEFGKGRKLFGPYFHRSQEGLKYVDLAVPSYDYPNWDWYIAPRVAKKPIWVDPYMDVGGGDVPMVTYSRPFFKDSRVWGIATADVALSDLTKNIEKIRVGKTGFAFLLSKNGVFLTMRDKDWNLKRTIFDLAKEQDNSELAQLGKRMVAGETGYEAVPDKETNQTLWVGFKPIEATQWSMGVVFPEEELLSDLTTMRQRLIIIGAAGILFLTLIIALVSTRISRPIHALAEAAKRISAGDLQTPPPSQGSSDEIRMLANSFGEMQRSLLSTLSDLRAEKDIFNTSFTQMSDGLVILDSQWRPLKHNRSAEKLLSLPAKGNIIEHIHGRFTCACEMEKIENMLKGRFEASSFEIKRCEKEGETPLILSISVTPIKNEAGVLKLIVMGIRDVTAEAQEEKQKRNFLSLVSHKLRTPISVIQSNIALMRDGILGELSEKQQKQTIVMSDQAIKLTALIDRLINFVQIESGEFDAKKEDIELDKFINGLAAEAKEIHREKHPEIEISISDKAQKISFNKNYLRMIVSHLIENGLKFNKSDPARLSISIKPEEGFTAISFADNGVGIPPDLQEKIFDKFFQIDKYFTGNVEGVGLGLSYVRQIAEHFGGTIEVKSSHGKGSEFILKLPA